MACRIDHRAGLCGQRAAAMVLGLAALVFFPVDALALITGGTGNAPIADPGWPKGGTAIFNHPARIAWWEGPPFGGGQWHAECRGDAKTLSAILTGFSRLDVRTKRVYVHDGVGASFWINPNRETDKALDARIDWMFMVWQPESWGRLRNLPASLNPTDPHDADTGPPAELHIYTGGNVRWSEVTLPKGLEVIDERMEAHGFSSADGVVLEGKVSDLAARASIAAAARVELQRVEPRKTGGGYDYPVAATAATDAGGRWVLKKVPAGWYRVVVAADGFVPRVAGYAQFDGQPRWTSHDCGLARPATVSGRVTDDSGQPLADVTVRFSDVAAGAAGRYESPLEYDRKTDADGRFRGEGLPIGTATIWVSKFGYCRPGLGQPVNTPTADVALVMKKSARLRVVVDFGGASRPEGYIVSIEPDGGNVVGSWGGSGNIDAQNQVAFSDIPPGRYIVTGQPNPSSGDQKTKPLTLDLKGGRLAEVTLKPGAKD